MVSGQTAGAAHTQDAGRFPPKLKKPAKQVATLHSSWYPHTSFQAARNRMGLGEWWGDLLIPSSFYTSAKN